MRPQLAEMTERKGLLLLTCLLNYRMPPVLAGACPTLFSSLAFSRASCPQKRSSSAIFASADGA